MHLTDPFLASAHSAARHYCQYWWVKRQRYTLVASAVFPMLGRPAIEAPKPRGHTSDAAVMVKRQLGTFGSMAQHLVQCLKPASRVARLGEPEQTAFGLLDDRHGAVLLLQPGLIRMT
jgi:hypothetical protein